MARIHCLKFQCVLVLKLRRTSPKINTVRIPIRGWGLGQAFNRGPWAPSMEPPLELSNLAAPASWAQAQLDYASDLDIDKE